MPPTTPPTILPEFELPLDDGVNEGDDTGEGVLGITVDWAFLVEVRRGVVLPVVSAEAVTGRAYVEGWDLLEKLRTGSKPCRC